MCFYSQTIHWASSSAALCSTLQNTRFLSGVWAQFFQEAKPEASRMRAWCIFHFYQTRKTIFIKMKSAPLSRNTRPGLPRGLTSIHQSSLLLKEFAVFSRNPSFHLSNFILFPHGIPLGLPWSSWPSSAPPLGPLRVVMLSQVSLYSFWL